MSDEKRNVYEKGGKLYEDSGSIWTEDRCLGGIKQETSLISNNYGKGVVHVSKILGKDETYVITPPSPFNIEKSIHHEATISDDRGRTGILRDIPFNDHVGQYSGISRKGSLSHPSSPTHSSPTLSSSNYSDYDNSSSSPTTTSNKSSWNITEHPVLAITLALLAIILLPFIIPLILTVGGIILGLVIAYGILSFLNSL